MNNNNIAVTIGFPVYNVEKYIEKSLCSALQQDFDNPYEILVIDDCGSDKSMDIVHDLAANHPKGNIIRIIKRNNNKGVGEARNLIIKEALGKYLFFLDSDDYISHDCLSILYEKALLYDCDVVAGSYKCVSEKGEILNMLKLPDVNFKDMPVFGGHWQVAVWNKLYRLDFLRKNNIGCIHKYFEDVIFNYKLCLCINSVAMTSHCTLSYLERRASITDVSNKKPNNEMIQVYGEIINTMGQLASEKEYIDGIWDYYVSSVRFIFAAVSRKNFTRKQLNWFKKSINGYMRIIPSYITLKSNTHRVLYFLSYIISDYKLFLWFYAKIEFLRTKMVSLKKHH